MRIYISVDMEGIAGIVDECHWLLGQPRYDMACELMVGEANAAIGAAVEAGAQEIVVNDSHHNMINLLPERLRPEAKVIQGRIKTLSMCEGMDTGFDAAIFIGYHASRGAKHGVLDHTYSAILHDVRINGRRVNEAHINGLVAGHFGIPLVLVSGDQALAEEMRTWDERIRTCVVKESTGRQSTKSLHPERARALIHQAALETLRSPENFPEPMRLAPPLVLDIELMNTQMADMLERVVGITRTGGRTVQAQAPDALTIYRYFLTAMSMAGTVR